MVTFTIKNNMFRFLLLCLLVNQVQAASITSHVDRNPVSLDESFNLVLEANGSVDGNPDLNVLKKDFDILNTSQNTSMSFINGAMSQKRTWTIALMGKQPGIFTIPSIRFGKDISPSLRVTIKKQALSTNNNPGSTEKDIFIDVEVDQKNIWVQSQIIYTIRIFHTVNINNPHLSQVETSDKDAIIQRLGDAENYEAFINSVRYNVTLLRFAVYPQHSGNLIFKPVLLEGRISANNSRSFFGQFFGGGKIRRVRSKSLSVRIKPRPDNIQLKNWLPASNVTLSDNWSEDIQQLKTGEPVTRTITLTADGQMAALLPDLKLPDINGFKQYPDKPVQQNTPSQNGITGSRQIKIALIPTRAGNYKLPAISLHWWNTKTGQEEIVHLPERVLKATGTANTTENLPVEQTSQSSLQGSAPENRADDYLANILPLTAEYRTIFWPWLSLALTTGWLITLVAYFRKRRSPTKAEIKPKKQVPPVRPLEKTVIRQCKKNDVKQTKDALLAWAGVRWPDKSVTSLADIARLSPPALNEAIMSLNTALYSANSRNWIGKQLSKTFEKHKKQAPENSPSNKSILEPLYKT